MTTPAERLALIDGHWYPLLDRAREHRDTEAMDAIIRARVKELDADPEAQALAQEQYDAEQALFAARDAERSRIERLTGLTDGFRVPSTPLLDVPGLVRGERWRGWTIEGYGELLDASPSPDGETAPWWWSFDVGEGTALLVRLHRFVIRAPGTPVYLEGLWNPGTGPGMAVVGVEHARPADVKRVSDARSIIIKRLDRRGRPPGRAYTPAELDRSLYREATARRARPGKGQVRLTRRTMAAALHVSETLLYTMLREYGLDFDRLVGNRGGDPPA